MANSVNHASLPYVIRGAKFTVPLLFLDADGDPTDPGAPDTEISKDGTTFTDAAEAGDATIIPGSNGAAYITLNGDETNASLLMVAAKSTTGNAKSTILTLFPRSLPVIRSGTAQGGTSGSIILDAGASNLPNYYVGCIAKTTGGTGGGGGAGMLGNQARIIISYDNVTKEAGVAPIYEVAPASGTTFEILLTENAFYSLSDMQGWRGSVPNALVSGRVDASVGALGTGAITSSSIAAGAITNTAYAAGAIDANAIATDAIGSAELAASAVTKIAAGITVPTAAQNATAVWSEDLPGAYTGADAGAKLNTAASGGGGLTVGQVTDAVWDATTTGNVGAGTMGGLLNAAGSAGDPWVTALPGGYTAGQAGNILGNRLDAAVTTRASQASITTLQSDTDDIQTRLPAALVGGKMEANVGTVTAGAINAAALGADAITAAKLAPDVTTELQAGLATATNLAAVKTDTATILTAVDTEVAAIKAKTDNLPAAPAAAGDAMTLAPAERTAIANALLDLADAIETGVTLRQSQRLALSALVGTLSGAGTATEVMRNAVANTKSRITATVTPEGNRTAVVTDST